MFYTFGHLKHYSNERHGPSKKIPPWQQPVLVKELSKTPSFIAFQMLRVSVSTHNFYHRKWSACGLICVLTFASLVTRFKERDLLLVRSFFKGVSGKWLEVSLKGFLTVNLISKNQILFYLVPTNSCLLAHFKSICKTFSAHKIVICFHLACSS